jgi:tetratricopeptide (TPR) repeat protein
VEKDYTARVLTPAESAAIRGDFLLHTRRFTEARALLEEALKLDPKLAAAHESMGLMAYQQGNHEEAAKWLTQAIQLDSKSSLAYYLNATLMVRGGFRSGDASQAEQNLKRSIELNANFAPAQNLLAFFYISKQGRLKEALDAAQKAVQLEPGAPEYQLGLAQVLMRMDRLDDARAVANRALANAASPEARSAAQSVLAEIDLYGEYLAERKRNEEAMRVSQQQMAAQSEQAPRTAATPPGKSPASASRPQAASATKPGPATTITGKIAEVSCANSPQLMLTFLVGNFDVKLRAPNLFKLEYLSSGWQPPPKFDPCKHLSGHKAKITYVLIHGQDYDGEIQQIEIQP